MKSKKADMASEKIGEKGFVILFSMLVSLIISLIAAGMFSIASKQTKLSTYTRESQKAFYVANSALECALYHDISPDLDKTNFPTDGTDPSVISCGGNDLPIYKLPITTNDYTMGYSYEHVFAFNYFPVGGSVFNGGWGNILRKSDAGCAYVLLEKHVQNLDEHTDQVNTRVVAIGFNTCDEEGYPDFNDPLLLERRIGSRYVSYILK